MAEPGLQYWGEQAGGKGLHQGGKHIREARRADAISAEGLGSTYYLRHSNCVDLSSKKVTVP